uniref:hypothetical protein n=1 Tax=Micromonospora maritima TaxID=986711 RepID=UPI00157C1052
MARGPERPADGPDERRDPRGKGRRWGRGRAEAEPDPAVAGEEFGWIDDLRTAKQERGELGPDGVPRYRSEYIDPIAAIQSD